ncbi:hypothetical protein PVK06_009187 [Gossypium arboreum]|uniref:C2 NT-type domain-containing protein n=1 Tax=Gossypium arboreum TaxID=29729 RepID=A0ABR0QLV1_GOSAR|nr:hypothetical protein PVK06_009187 [Gossypium arboreum]
MLKHQQIRYQIPQSGWDKLYISFVPADSGKTTAKTTKANVRNGTCKWADPVYETTRLLQDIKTKQFDGKLYKLVAAMVTVQLLTSKTGFREFEQQRELSGRGLQVGPDQNGPDQSYSGKVSVSEEIVNNRIDNSFIEEYRLQDMFLLSKSVILRCMISLLQENCLQILPGSVNVRVRFIEKSKEQPLLEDVALNDDCGDSNVGFHGSSNNSDSLYAEKHEMSSAHENDGQKSTVYVAGLDYSADNDMTIAYEENNRLRGFLEVAESSIQELKMELSLLQNHANQMGDETEKFAEQLVAEISSRERLAKEVSALRSECLKLKGDLVQMTSSKPYPPLNSKEPIKKDQNLSRLRDLGALLGILQDLKQRTQKEISILRSVEDRCNTKAPGAMSSTNGDAFIPKTSFDVELYQPELGMVPCVSEPGHMPHEPDSLGATNAMKGKIFTNAIKVRL